ncbi:hypothetical protein O6H91_11G006900 [Diphasiastrum complanatum]|uniref:Uncharacterized protein n=1 Tax=Diphasiastrum complanatum TaxID=34168 RepID=A0ACC2C6K0_DIPCM|nr:hypothetical protein O6H91_11G006900 [Diphasiastrum complanatum]
MDPTNEENFGKPVSLIGLLQFADFVDYLLIILGTIAALLHGVASPYTIMQYSSFYNSLGTNEDLTFQIMKLAKLVCYIGVAILFFTSIGNVGYVEIICWTLTGERQTIRIRARYVEALLSQDMAYFDTNMESAHIINSITCDTALVHDAIGEKSLIMSNFHNDHHDSITITNHFSFQLSKHDPFCLKQGILQIRSVASFVGESRMMKAFSQEIKKGTKLLRIVGICKGLGIGSIFCITYLSWALQASFATKFVIRGELKGGTAFVIIFLGFSASSSLGMALQGLEVFGKGKAAATRLFQIMHEHSNIKYKNLRGDILPNFEGQIDFCNVSFAYPARPDAHIFVDLSISIPAGKIIALVGPSGSGKSTIISLIDRFYDADKGEIRLDGHNIKSLQLKWLREQIGLVSQEPTMFSTSIKENILFGDKNVSDYEFLEAVEAANAHSFIMDLPETYNTQVGEGGAQMSGGQKQRIAIARAILKKPRILLLDEATSALDPESEHLVQNGLINLMNNRTTVVIAHRLSTIQNSDMIAVFEKGQIVEMGTHADLIANEEGVYKSLLELQQTKVPNCAHERSTSAVRDDDWQQFSVASSAEKQKLEVTDTSYYPDQATPVAKIFYENTISHIKSPSSPIQTPKISFDDLGKKLHKTYYSENLPSDLDESWWRILTWFGKILQKDQWCSWWVGAIGATAFGSMISLFPVVVATILLLWFEPDINKIKTETNIWIISFLLLGATSLCASLVQNVYFAKLGADASGILQERSLEDIMKHEIGWFDLEENSCSATTARISADAMAVNTMLCSSFSYGMQYLSAITLAIAMGLTFQWQIALIHLVVIPIQIVASAFKLMFTKGGIGGNSETAYEKPSQIAREAMANIRVVASCAAEEDVLNRFNQQMSRARRKRIFRATAGGLAFGIAHAAYTFSFALTFWFSVTVVKQHNAKPGSVIKAIFVLGYTAHQLLEVSKLLPEFRKGLSGVKCFFQISKQQTKIDPDDPNGYKPSSVSGNIEIKNVTFCYPSRPTVNVLQRVNLVVPAKTNVALVGASGSGKSSIIALIERFYDPSSGEILIDGRNLKTFNLRWIRQHIGLVQQQPALFAFSIRENILYGKENASEEEMIAAAKAASAHAFITSLPNGYDTQVGEGGSLLSGGQKQRIAIARAILKQPEILLLDEPTSALDANSEHIVQEALDGLIEKKTTTIITIAHRLSTVEHADVIVVLNEGRIVEMGTPHKLKLHQEGAYARLLRLQQQKEHDETS